MSDPEFIVCVRMDVFERPPVASKKVRCNRCTCDLWLSVATANALPILVKPICRNCAQLMADERGGKVSFSIPEGVRDEFAAFVARGGMDEKNN